MALRLDTSSATMTVDIKGAKSAIHIGKELVLLHGTRNANLAAADVPMGGKGNKGPSIVITGKVFMEADASDFDLGDWQFGMIQVSNLMVYEFVYAGRMANEGSVVLNLRSGFTKNPSLDADPPQGGSIDDDIFDIAHQTTKRVSTPRVGFEIEYRFGDHPNTLVPQKFENRQTNAPNFIASARRDEGFITYFVARENAQAPVQFLSRVGWHAIWHGTFTWSAAKMKPTLTTKDSRLDLGQVLLGAPVATDPDFQVAKARVGPTSNAMDEKASDDAFVHRRSPVCVQSTTLPKDLPSDFFQ
jgi:hypothetical protein